MSEPHIYQDKDEFGAKATNKTPFVWFSREGEFTMKGRCIPEEGALFFESMLAWVEDYIKEPCPATVFTIDLEYVNEVSSKYLLLVIKKLHASCRELTVNWIYEKDDEDLYEHGLILSSCSDAHFEFIELPPANFS